MAPKKEPEAPKPVLAVEYNGTLYPCMQKAEGARAKADLMALIPKHVSDCSGFHVWANLGRCGAIDGVIENAEQVHGILSRYLSAKEAP